MHVLSNDINSLITQTHPLGSPAIDDLGIKIPKFEFEHRKTTGGEKEHCMKRMTEA